MSDLLETVLEAHGGLPRWTRLAHQYHATPSQLALAWLLKRSPVMLPIPGTSSVAHLDENLDAIAIHLTDGQYAELRDAVS